MATTIGRFNIKLFIILIVIVFIVHIIFLKIIMSGSVMDDEQIDTITPPSEQVIDVTIEPRYVE